eukprot:2778277-Amphidinium_carterae.1
MKIVNDAGVLSTRSVSAQISIGRRRPLTVLSACGQVGPTKEDCVAQELMGCVWSNNIVTDYGIKHNSHHTPQGYELPPITVEQVEKVLHEAGGRKAPGLDQMRSCEVLALCSSSRRLACAYRQRHGLADQYI